jgi:hypothetical protein
MIYNVDDAKVIESVLYLKRICKSEQNKQCIKTENRNKHCTKTGNQNKHHPKTRNQNNFILKQK